MRTPPRRRSPRAGFTVLEVVIASVILMTLIMMALAAFSQTHRQLGESLVVTDASMHANQIEDRLQEELRSAGQFSRSDVRPPSTAFDRLDYVPRAGMTWGAARSIVWTPENDADSLAGEGMLEVRQGGALLFQLGSDVKSDFTVGFFRPDGTTLDGQTPDAAETELRVSFTVLGIKGVQGPQVLTHEEHRVIRITIRNRSS